MEQLVPWLHNPCHIKVPTMGENQNGNTNPGV